MTLASGTRLGPYEIVAPIGSGGMGDVYKARDTRLNRTVAIKVSQEQFSERFEREVQAVAALNHPNICQLFDVGADYLVMEFVDGRSIAPFDGVRKLLDVAVQIADGLAAAHTAGFVHRDLKPDNILLTADGRVKILDFGLAKQAASAGDLEVTAGPATGVGVIVGTATYMSPEQARGVAVDARSDQFSFGLILYELITGERAFQRNSTAETMTAIIREDAKALPAGVPAPLRWIVDRCLAKEPAERYDSTRDLYRELRQIRDHLSDSTVGPIAADLPVRRRSNVLPYAAITASAIAIGFVGATLWPIDPPDSSVFVPFASESEFQAMPRWSPTGDRIAYVAAVDGVLQVLTKSRASSSPTQITHEKQSCLNPMWSPDASRIYFLTGVRPNLSLRSIAVAGGAAETVLENVGQTADLSPDGATLAVLARQPEGDYRLAFSSPPGAPPQVYTRPPVADLRNNGPGTVLRFFPGGKYLGVSTNAPTGVQFWKVPVDGAVAQKLPTSNVSGANYDFSVTPDETKVVTGGANATDPSTSFHLAIVDLQSGRRRLITGGASQEMSYALSPDGRTLAFASGEAQFDIVEIPFDGSAPREVITAARSEYAASWVPDGVRFTYITTRSGVHEIWLRNRVDRSERPITTPGMFAGSALYDSAISPDGSRVAYRVQGGGRAAIWISPLSGDAPVRLWNDPANSPQRGPSWSPDGNSIAFYGIHDGRSAVMKARIGGASPPEFLADMGRLHPVRWSPRGDWIAFRDGDVLRIVAPDGKQNRVISRRIWETYGWSSDGTAVYGVGWDQRRRLSLTRIDLKTASESLVTDLGPVPPTFEFIDTYLNDFPYRGFSLHPDGRSFLTSVQRVRTQLYLMTDFDRTFRLADRWFKQGR